MAAASFVLAHQGGWDEMLMVLVPILIFAGLLVVANRRASRIGEQQSLAADGAGVEDDSDSPDADPRRSDGRAGP